MSKDFTAGESQAFWIAHGPKLHFGELAPGRSVSTGQKNLETFTDRREWMARVVELGGSFG